MSDIISRLEAKLLLLRDEKYRDFHAPLIPTVPYERILGVRTPILRKLARELDPETKEALLSGAPHRYYDEDNLHGFVIEGIRDRDECLVELERFLPYIDNWATCDLVRPKCFKKEPPSREIISAWIASPRTYTVRYGIGMLISYYHGERFEIGDLALVAGIKTDEYYIKMAAAWYFATVLTHHFEGALPFIERGIPDTWVHNMAIRKACESRAISDERKGILKELKKKENQS